MRRQGLSLLCAALAAGAAGQEAPTGGPAPLFYSRSINVPLNGPLMHDKAADAWNWTFGKEPGARVLRLVREESVLEGTARVNFRSKMLWLREETMGAIQYRVVVHSRAGECRVTVSELTHTGNRTTTRGGVHMGLLTQADRPLRDSPGTSVLALQRAYAEMKAVAEARIQSLLQAFEARLRANAEP
jgi:hypothetical protein